MSRLFQGGATSSSGGGGTGPAGANGNTVISVITAPTSGQGVNGDYAIDDIHWVIYGPKAAGAWPAGTSLIGPAGSTGSAGAAGTNGTNGTNGSNGTNGNTILNGSGAPGGGTGVNGDFYLDTAASAIYGPKAGGSWGSSTSLIGATGATGAAGTNGTNGTNGSAGSTGATGPAGPGVPTGGATNTALLKNSATDYDTVWTALTKSTVGLSNVDNTSDATKASALQTTFDARYQAISALLADIAGLTFAGNDIVQYKSGHLTNRTMAQLKTDLALTASDVSGVVPSTRLLAGLDLSADRTATAIKTALGFVTADVPAYFGDGTDGAATISGTTTLTNDMHYTNLAVTGTLNTACYRVYVSGTLSGNGTIANDSAGRIPPVSGSMTAGGTGAAGPTAAANGTNSSGPNSYAGAGGNGGASGGSQTGGIASPTAITLVGGPNAHYDPVMAPRGRWTTGGGLQGGGGGASGGLNTGTQTAGDGAGGGAGGPISIAAAVCTFSGVVSAKGISGTVPGASATNAGGGGGGGGGIIVLTTKSATQTFTTNVTAGSGAAGKGTGSSGANGSAGVTQIWTGVT